MQNLTGKVALITGGTSGIGAATAIRLTAQGAHVAIVGSGKSAAEAECVRRRIEENGASCLVIAADLSEPANVTASVQQTVAEFGRLDILVHSAGGPAPGGLFEVSEAVWYRAFDIHIHAIFHLCRAAVPVMQGSSEGAIILISSAAGLRGCLGAAAYGVVKGAVPQLTRVLARELADSGIRVNCVSPGVIRTRFQDALTPEQAQNNIDNRIPLHREGTPEEVADLVASILTNGFITGENIVIDGGMTMRIV